MARSFIRFALICLFGLIASVAAPDAARAGPATCGPPAHRGPFRVFDGLILADKPDLSRYGLEPIHIVDRGIWIDDNNRRGPPDRALVAQYLARLPADGAPLVLDFEDVDANATDPAAAARGIGWLAEIRAAFAAAGPRRPIGYYGALPGRDYWRAIRGPGTAEYRAWQRENDRLAPLERGVDLLFPSVYAFYDDPQGWVTYATAQICEARRISSKPVYVFLWFEYHPGTRPAGEFIPAAFWRLQLETVRRLADGVVIWGGYDQVALRARPWDPSAPWWRETLRFMSELHRGRSG